MFSVASVHIKPLEDRDADPSATPGSKANPYPSIQLAGPEV
jgi:hypothetical protein